jgi:hypothetical protein
MEQSFNLNENGTIIFVHTFSPDTWYHDKSAQVVNVL